MPRRGDCDSLRAFGGNQRQLGAGIAFLLISRSCLFTMTKTQSTEQAALVDFFSRGDAYAATANSLEPPMREDFSDLGASDGDVRLFLRTPEQEARRRKFIRLVSGVVTALAVGTALAVVGNWLFRSREPAAAATEVGVEAQAPVQPVVNASIPTKSEKPTALRLEATPIPAKPEQETKVASVVVPVVAPKGSAEPAAKVAVVVAPVAAPLRKAATAPAAKANVALSQVADGGTEPARTAPPRSRRVTATRPPVGDYRPPTAVFAD